MPSSHDFDTLDGSGPVRRCLVVDDSSVIRKVARVILDDFRFEVIEAGNCKEAGDLCGGVAPNVILLDWNIPGESSIDFLAQLRARKLRHRPFIIYMTTENDPVDIARALDAGADDYMLKPFTRLSLGEKIEPIGSIVAMS